MPLEIGETYRTTFAPVNPWSNSDEAKTFPDWFVNSQPNWYKVGRSSSEIRKGHFNKVPPKVKSWEFDDVLGEMDRMMSEGDAYGKRWDETHIKYTRLYGEDATSKLNERISAGLDWQQIGRAKKEGAMHHEYRSEEDKKLELGKLKAKKRDEYLDKQKSQKINMHVVRIAERDGNEEAKNRSWEWLYDEFADKLIRKDDRPHLVYADDETDKEEDKETMPQQKIYEKHKEPDPLPDWSIEAAADWEKEMADMVAEQPKGDPKHISYKKDPRYYDFIDDESEKAEYLRRRKAERKADRLARLRREGQTFGTNDSDQYKFKQQQMFERDDFDYDRVKEYMIEQHNYTESIDLSKITPQNTEWLAFSSHGNITLQDDPELHTEYGIPHSFHTIRDSGGNIHSAFDPTSVTPHFGNAQQSEITHKTTVAAT